MWSSLENQAFHENSGEFCSRLGFLSAHSNIRWGWKQQNNKYSARLQFPQDRQLVGMFFFLSLLKCISSTKTCLVRRVSSKVISFGMSRNMDVLWFFRYFRTCTVSTLHPPRPGGVCKWCGKGKRTSVAVAAAAVLRFRISVLYIKESIWFKEVKKN